MVNNSKLGALIRSSAVRSLLNFYIFCWPVAPLGESCHHNNDGSWRNFYGIHLFRKWLLMLLARFFVVAVAGLAVDTAIAWAFVHFFEVSVWLAVSIGFGVATLVTYAAHECWTYPVGMRKLSSARALRYVVLLAVALCARWVTVATLMSITGDVPLIVILLAGAGVSCCVSFLLGKHFVFLPRSDA